MRGDPPYDHRIRGNQKMSTPHARGSTSSSSMLILLPLVYPACAGIHLQTVVQAPEPARLPRMRGDPPKPGCFVPV